MAGADSAREAAKKFTAQGPGLGLAPHASLGMTGDLWGSLLGLRMYLDDADWGLLSGIGIVDMENKAPDLRRVI